MELAVQNKHKHEEKEKEKEKDKEEKKTICLNMIVKNEAHVIEKTFNMLLSKIPINYWVISDTGSTDGTQDLIVQYFKKLGLNGELYNDPWRDFGYNRTRALEHAYKKTDYLLIFDADDELFGNPIIPELVADAYNLLFKTPTGVCYNRLMLIRNDIKWRFRGILHECLNMCDEVIAKTRRPVYGNIEGEYHVLSGRQGDRSKNPYKYLIDGLKLEVGFIEEQEKDLKERYAFYCANSYKDYAEYTQICIASDIKHENYEKNQMMKDYDTDKKITECYEKAIEWYKKVLEFNNWKQEKYVSYLRIYRCYCKLNRKKEGLSYLAEAYTADSERFECVAELITHYLHLEMYDLCFIYYSSISDHFENERYVPMVHEKLFLEEPIYSFVLPYLMIVVCDKLKKYHLAKKMFRIIFRQIFKAPVKDINCVLYNLQTVIGVSEGREKDIEFNKLAKSYIQFLQDSGYDVNQCGCMHMYEKYGIVERTKTKKKILFYTGYTDKKWNLSQSISGSLGGSERAVIYLARALRKINKEYQIYITGTVENEIWDGIHFVDLNNLPQLLKDNYFNTIIVSRYVSFFELYDFNSGRIIVWAHDTEFVNYGCNLSIREILKKWNHRIDGYVCLTEWQKKLFEQMYPMIVGKIHLINNGIDLNLFTMNQTKTKIRNSFVFSSRSERGLARLLEIWPQIIELFPDARLNICSYVDFPNNQNDILMKGIIDLHSNSIKHHGKLNQIQLYELMEKSEYWLYPSFWPETSCITSMEMLASGVTCLYYPIAGLPETIGKIGYECEKGSEISVLQHLSEQEQEQDKESMRIRGYEYAVSCSWDSDSRAGKWEKLLSEGYGAIKIVNLTRRPDRRNAMIQKLNDAGVTKYDFFEAIDGKKVTLTHGIKKMFVGNDFYDKKGVIGCSLSHSGLWEQLINDPENNYYIILEDDVVFTNDFVEKLKLCCSYFVRYQIEYLMIGALFVQTQNVDENNLQFVRDKHQDFSGTYGYMISKNAALKMIQHIQLNGMRHAIDNPMIRISLASVYHLNQWIVYSDSFQNHGNLDTDIQTDTDRFDFSTIKFEKSMIGENIRKKGTCNISMCDFWINEYMGGVFDPNDNFLINLVRKHNHGIEINLIEPGPESDVVIYSLFGKTNYNLIDKYRVFFSGEATGICQEADYNITFNHNSEKNLRLPLWVYYMDMGLVHKSNQRIRGMYDIPENREKFCSFICSNPDALGNRIIMVNKISEYKRIDSGGPFMNNIGYVVPRGINCSGKIEHNNNYKFAIAFENCEMPGYCTEKICDIFKSNCIPIYWGTKDIVLDFNPKCFINVNDFQNLDDLNKWIEKVDTDPEIYASYFKEPILSDHWLEIFNDPEQKFFSSLAKNIIGL
jgi:GR25 family glycosyltransferase involved in LPS biosynthesis/glycosyltransferase involved in cell wall biosynthesis